MTRKELLAKWDDVPPLITVIEACRLLGVGRTAGYKAAQSGDLPTLRWGKRLYVSTARLMEMVGHDGPDPVGRTRSIRGPTRG